MSLYELMDPMDAVIRLESLWDTGSGASLGAGRILHFTLNGEGRIAPEDLLRLDDNNRAAALTLIQFSLAGGAETVWAPKELRSDLWEKFSA